MRKTLAAAMAVTAAVTTAGLTVGAAGPAQATMYGNHDVHGQIESEYLRRGGPDGFLGLPTTNEKSTPDGLGRFNYFQGGAIYWTGGTGAHEVHGTIRSRWTVLSAQAGPLGYPIQEQRSTPKVIGQYSLFQNGSIYSSAATGTHEVYGAILQAWGSIGYENSQLGFPTSGEKAVPGGRRNNFQGGYIVWRPETGAVIHIRK